MFSNYLKIAWRSLLKNRLFTLLNSLGLAIGLAVALMLLLYATDELAFDKHHRNADRIARVNLNVSFDGQTQQWGNAPNMVGPTMKAQLPGVENQVRLLRHNFGQTAFVNSANREFAETKLYWADSTLFSVFDVPLLLGNPATALAGPNRVVVSQNTAHRYFGTQNPLGKILDVDHKHPLEITGVYPDLPATSSLDADLIGSFASVKWASEPSSQSWSNASFETYLLLRPNANVAQLERQMEAIVAKNVPKDNRFYSLYLQPLADIHLHSANLNNVSSTRIGDARQVTILLLLAVVVLLIACINYMNLTTAQAQVRAKEVGINKVVGATRSQLIGRFYAETVLVVLVSLLLGIGVVIACLPLFNNIADKSLSVWTLLTPRMLLSLLGLGVGISLLAGLYPAFVLSGFSVRGLLQSSFRAGSGGGFLRRSLVVTQFVASLVLIISTLLFYRQLQFIQHRKLGYNPTQVVAITTAAAQNPDQVQALSNDLRALSSVDDISRVQVYPGGGGSGRSLSKPLDDGSQLQITSNRANSTFIKVLGLKLLAGKTLPAAKSDQPDTDNETDTTIQVVLNKTAVDFLGYTPEQAIGKIAPGLFENRAEIVGVVDDFHFESLHKPIGAYAFHNANTERRSYMLAKVRTQNLPETMRQLEATYRKNLPNSAFEFTFLDTYLNTLYRSEQRMAQVVLIFAGLAILIACLGLFGLATFTAEQRTKEIGVRKVLGASVGSIVALLSKDFLKLVLIAIVLAIPLAWWAISSWLADFAYRIDIEWWVFAGAGALVVFIALLTVSFQSIKAALMNPIQSLRSE
ncbi:Macrolide export ATP-binding/permease protein macB [Fibrella aestuarina BUZ 2]|uniref:Macrolide export ATP-binding/permease protein macB n=1 Tax=Fibrella aestuarina BUZ 2 TaxID=1166018 RepID=I0K1V7_9BACT|nr:ABC transporter permease [Fibrella aestuarina]CCG98110.1 Macrolide export ATP-binding/permease protein macB [Fibrella aestuarina BUZ 2]